MGTFEIEAKVWNPFDRLREAEVELVVDSGSTYTVLPKSLLEGIRVKPIRVARLRLADSSVVEKALGEVGIAINEYVASATPVVFGDEDVHLLGAVVMEQLSLAPDPGKRIPVPVEALLTAFMNKNSSQKIHLDYISHKQASARAQEIYTLDNRMEQVCSRILSEVSS